MKIMTTDKEPMTTDKVTEKPTLTLHKFYFDAQQRARIRVERYGQAMFNHLDRVRPDLSAQIRATDKDPFYVERLNDPRWDRFVTFLEANWAVSNERELEKLRLLLIDELRKG